MADTAPITPAVNAATFNPAQWLSHFESNGGGFLATESQTSICVAYQGTSREQQAAAHAMMAQLTDDQRAEVLAVIRERAGMDAVQPDLNAIPLERLSCPAGIDQPSSGNALGDQSKGATDMDMTHVFEAIAPFDVSILSTTGTGGEFGAAVDAWAKTVKAIEELNGDEDIPDAMCNAQSDAFRAMLDMPSPDLAALRFKLMHLLHVEQAVDQTNAWSGHEVRQTLADIERLMKQPSAHVVAWQARQAAHALYIGGGNSQRSPIATDAVSAWHSAMDRLDAAKAEYDAHEKLCEVEREEDDQLGRNLYDSERVLMETQAPDWQAVRWKLQHLQNVSDGETIDAVAFSQVLSDVDRLVIAG